MYPLFVFDVSKQSERINTGIVDIAVKMQFKTNVGSGVRAYALLLSDRLLQLKSNGKMTSVI